MKNLCKITSILAIIALTFSCDKNDPAAIPFEHFIGGDTDIPLGQVGNTVATTINIGGSYYDTQEDIKIIENDNGVVKLQYIADFSGIPQLSKLVDLIPSTELDGTGKVNTIIKLKITSEGIQDYVNDDDYAHTLIRYDSGVGEAYSFQHTDGRVQTRQVTAKSTVDDYPWGFWNIKTTTVEQKAPIPGVAKYVIRANHKFGIVYGEMILEDGTSIGMDIFPKNY